MRDLLRAFYQKRADELQAAYMVETDSQKAKRIELDLLPLLAWLENDKKQGQGDE